MRLEIPNGPPETSEALLARARTLAGRTLSEVADTLGHRLPPDISRAKGWVGQLVEDALGAASGSRPVPDFEGLGIELKTVPVDARGRPRESTYITALSVRPDVSAFETSTLGHKLAKVLFIPVESQPELHLGVRRLGAPLFWTPQGDDLALLREDWSTFASYIAAGSIDGIGSRVGRVLQVRPKGADAEDTTWVSGPDGSPIRTMRRGVYLRASFVHELFRRSFHMPGSDAPKNP